MALSAPLFLFYYFTVGARHRLLWHGSLAGALAAGLTANLFWLLDWIDYGWIRTPLNLEVPVLTPRTLSALRAAPLWGEPADRDAGLFPWPRRPWSASSCCTRTAGGRRPGCSASGAGGWLALAAAAVVWGLLSHVGAERLFALALLIAGFLAAYGLAQTLRADPAAGAVKAACLIGGKRWPPLTARLCRRTGTLWVQPRAPGYAAIDRTRPRPRERGRRC